MCVQQCIVDCDTAWKPLRLHGAIPRIPSQGLALNTASQAPSSALSATTAQKLPLTSLDASRFQLWSQRGVRGSVVGRNTNSQHPPSQEETPFPAVFGETRPDIVEDASRKSHTSSFDVLHDNTSISGLSGRTSARRRFRPPNPGQCTSGPRKEHTEDQDPAQVNS